MSCAYQSVSTRTVSPGATGRSIVLKIGRVDRVPAGRRLEAPGAAQRHGAGRRAQVLRDDEHPRHQPRRLARLGRRRRRAASPPRWPRRSRRRAARRSPRRSAPTARPVAFTAVVQPVAAFAFERHLIGLVLGRAGRAPGSRARCPPRAPGSAGRAAAGAAVAPRAAAACRCRAGGDWDGGVTSIGLGA